MPSSTGDAGLRAALALLAVTLLLGACGTDSDDVSGSAAPTAEAVASEAFPPNDFVELAEIFNPMVEPLGLRLTRGALIDRSDNGYQESDEGTHLALYVEPIDEGEWATEDYVAGVYDLTAIVTPYVFETWSEVESYDICQEPPNSEDASPEPFPETQIEITRAFDASFDWDTGNIVSLLAAEIGDDGARVVVGRSVRDHPDYRVALEEAQALAAGELEIPTTTAG